MTHDPLIYGEMNSLIKQNHDNFIFIIKPLGNLALHKKLKINLSNLDFKSNLRTFSWFYLYTQLVLGLEGFGAIIIRQRLYHFNYRLSCFCFVFCLHIIPGNNISKKIFNISLSFINPRQKFDKLYFKNTKTQLIIIDTNFA